MMLALALVCLAFALLPALLYFRNVKLFAPPPDSIDGDMPEISLLIPARNEELCLHAAIESVLQSKGITLELIVLDDQSTDRTAEIVAAFAAQDPRVKLRHAQPLPPGWCGKQFACHQLALLATHEIITFLDADVRLEPTALSWMIAFQKQSKAALVSGFPRQETGTLLEKLVIPLMHWLLLGFLPFDRMRKDIRPGLGAGCGQWFLTTKSEYHKAGGHEAIKDSLHDGIKLPRAYRKAGMMTDVCDVTALARCRMYRNAGQVWNGLAKNAHEGLGSTKLLPFTTVLLLMGHVVPWLALPFVFGSDVIATILLLLTCAVSCVPRWHAAGHFRQSWFGAVLHPVGVVCLLSIQWYAALRRLIGLPVGWKGRPVPTTQKNYHHEPN